MDTPTAAVTLTFWTSSRVWAANTTRGVRTVNTVAWASTKTHPLSPMTRTYVSNVTVTQWAQRTTAVMEPAFVNVKKALLESNVMNVSPVTTGNKAASRTCATRSFSCARTVGHAFRTSVVSARQTLRAFCANSHAVTQVKSATVPAGSVWAWPCFSARSSPSCWARTLPEIPLHHQQRAQRGHNAHQRPLPGAEHPAGDRERESETLPELEKYIHAPTTYKDKTHSTQIFN